jgi:amidohydrolase
MSAGSKQLNDEIKKNVEAIVDRLVDVRRTIHANPELAFEEFETAALVAGILKEQGIAFRDRIAKTGVVGLIRGTANERDSARTIGVRADLDCLPVPEESGLPFASRNPGKSHCCGHDIHTTILLGAGIVLSNMKERFAGQVKLIFQPAEETLSGAKPMIEAGVLENPHVDFMLGYHVWPVLEAGKVGYHPGPVMASSDGFDVVLKGTSGHAAHPHLAIDPIAAAAFFITELQTIVSREIAPIAPAVVTVGSISGGTVRNVIPDTVTIRGTIRTLDAGARTHCEAALRRILDGIKTGMRVGYDLSFERMVPVLENDKALLARVLESAREILGPENVRELPGSSMGSEDFACFAELRPAAHLRIGSKVEGRPSVLHNARFVASEGAIPTGVETVVRAVLELLH